MCRVLAALVVGCVLACAALGHPWHSSTGELDWNAEAGVFELALEVDAYHLEAALSRGVEGWVDLESERGGEMVAGALGDAFVVWTRAVGADGEGVGDWERASYEFVGREVDGGSAWVYAEFVPGGEGSGVIEAMVRNVFLRGELPELAVTVRVGGGAARAVGTGDGDAGGDEELGGADGDADAGGVGGAGSVEVLNFVRADAAAGHRPKGVGVVFRYGLTEAGYLKRARHHLDRAFAKAKLGDLRGAVLEGALSEDLLRTADRRGRPAGASQHEIVRGLFESWDEPDTGDERSLDLLGMMLFRESSLLTVVAQGGFEDATSVLLEGVEAGAVFERMERFVTRQTPSLELESAQAEGRSICEAIGLAGFISRAGTSEERTFVMSFPVEVESYETYVETVVKFLYFAGWAYGLQRD